ncbi:hypothetical protein [Peribacillus phoenicis]|uniref:hypothetical protein n=1 Tax=Peribacillus sp. 1P06PA-2 TaxID=3132295 RepID=UPI0039A50149
MKELAKFGAQTRLGARRLPDRPRKASAWRGNQRPLYKPKKLKTNSIFIEVSLQSDGAFMRFRFLYVNKVVKL